MAVAAVDWEALHPSKVVTEMILLLGFAAKILFKPVGAENTMSAEIRARHFLLSEF